MYCKKCGKKLNDDDRFCSSCGTKVTPETVVRDDVTYGLGDEEKESDDQERKPFVIEKFDWDLEGFPTGSSEKESYEAEEEVDFNWSPVMERKRMQAAAEEEPEAAEPVEEKEDSFLETFEEKVVSTEPVEFDWSQGTTTRFDRADLNAPDKADEVVELTMDDLKIDEPEADSDREESAAEKKAKADKASVDKFYTFNKKNAEFQALLDQEYERLRQRLREEAEAEEMLSERYKRMEEARNTWAPEVEADKEDELAAEVQNETGNEEAEGSQEEGRVEESVTEVAADEKAAEPQDEEKPEENEPSETEQEVTPSSREAEMEASLEEEAEVEQPEAESAKENTVEKTAEKDADWKVARNAAAVAGAAMADSGIGAAESATASIVAEEVAQVISEVQKASEVVRVKNVPVIKDDEAGVQVAQPLLPLTADYVGPVAYHCKPTKKGESAGEDSGNKKGTVDYCNIFDDEIEDEKPKKSRKGLKIFLDIIIIILIIVIACLGIMVFARDSVLGQKLDAGYKKVVSMVTGKPEVKDTKGGDTTENPIKKLVDNATGLNKNVKSVSYDPTLVLDLNTDYKVNGLKESNPFIDSVWYTGDDGNAVNYGDQIMGTVIKYYSAYADKENGNSDDVLSFVKPDTALYKQVKDIKGRSGKDYEIQSLKIGEMRNNGNYYYVLVETTVLEGKDSSPQTSKSIVELQAAEKNVLITNIYKAE